MLFLGHDTRIGMFKYAKLPVFRCVIVSMACWACSDADSAFMDDPGPVVMSVIPMDTLDAAGGPVLAKPVGIAVDSRGRFIVGDGSDQDIKVYESGGIRSSIIGRPGPGPGEFTKLASSGIMRDSIVAYDFVGGRLTVFNPGGEYRRSVSLQSSGTPTIFQTRVVDDSLILISGYPLGHPKENLLRLVASDGSDRSSFFRRPDFFALPDLISHTVVWADARDGYVFAAHYGGDSAYVYSYQGRLVGSGPIGLANRVLVTFRQIIEGQGGRLRKADGGWGHHGVLAVVNIVALDRGRAILQLAELDMVSGTDVFSTGGLLVAVALGPGGRLHTIGQVQTEGGLLGRDREGNALVLRWLGPQLELVEVRRVTMSEQEPEF